MLVNLLRARNKKKTEVVKNQDITRNLQTVKANQEKENNNNELLEKDTKNKQTIGRINRKIDKKQLSKLQ